MAIRRHPDWIKARLPSGTEAARVMAILRRCRTETVCREARCPNQGECFAEGTATFMILGHVCSRNCSFCAVEHGMPAPPDPDERERVARAAAELGLRHVVITSVTRDDLPDGGAGHFRACVEAIRAALPECSIEVLVPDFRGRHESVDCVAGAPIDVFNHNVETVPRLYGRVRPQADFERSIGVLERARRVRPPLATKSGMMLGLGERDDEIEMVLGRLHAAGCSIVTLGQYLQPSSGQVPVERYVQPQEFARWAERARKIGFVEVAAGPLVRSSYRAGACWVAVRSREQQK